MFCVPVCGFQGGTIGAVKAGSRFCRIRERDAIRHGNVTPAGVQNGGEYLQNHLFQVVGVVCVAFSVCYPTAAQQR
jgi:hypothetical protein